MIGTRTQFFRHIEKWKQLMTEQHGMTLKDFFAMHGEVPYDDENPRDRLSADLAKSVERAEQTKKIFATLSVILGLGFAICNGQQYGGVDNATQFQINQALMQPCNRGSSYSTTNAPYPPDLSWFWRNMERINRDADIAWKREQREWAKVMARYEH